MPIYKEGVEGELKRKPRIPRLGIIRLGTLETGHKDGRDYTYPQASDHFLLPDVENVAEVYGNNCTVLDPIIIPVEDEDAVAAHYYRMYSGNQRLLCIGDNVKADRWVDLDQLQKTGDLAPAKHDCHNPGWKEIKCPCPFLKSGQCQESLYLRFALPDVTGVGVWQLRTNSYNSIQQLQGCMAMVRAIAGQVAGIPLKLSLVATSIHSVGRGGMVNVHLLKLEVSGDVTIPQLAAMGRRPVAALPAPKLGAVIDADYDNEENSDPEMTGWTSKEDLAAAEAAQAEDTLTEADFDQPSDQPAQAEAVPPAEPPAAKQPAKGRQPRNNRQNPPPDPDDPDPVASSLPPDQVVILKERRRSLADVIRDIVPAEQLTEISADLTGFFNKGRLVMLSLDELEQAPQKFRDKYVPEAAVPPQ